MINGWKVFDTHTHMGTAHHTGRVQLAGDLLKGMDREGIDHSLVIPFPVVEDYRTAHNEIGAAVKRYPDRFLGAACIPPFIKESAYRDEVRRCREEFGFVALKLQPQYQALNPISSRSDFVFESALENGMVMVCHTGSGVPFALPSLFMMAARRFPGLTFVLSHCGGGGLLVGEAIVAASFCENIYLETSTLMPHHVLEVLTHIPVNKVMVGSDLPESLHTEIYKVAELAIPDADRRALLAETAYAVFGNPSRDAIAAGTAHADSYPQERT